MKVLLVDDEYLALNLLEEYIGRLTDIEIVGKIKSPVQALEILQAQAVDLLFLDIQMPGLSGNNLLKTLKKPPLTIFTTAYSEYAVEAFELNVVDYLMKPFSFERFLQALMKAKDVLTAAGVPAPAPSPNTPAAREFLSVKVDGKVQKIFLDQILFIEGLKEYMRIVCSNGKFITLGSLRNMEESLPAARFLRVHKSYIVAIPFVNALNGNMLEIGAHKIPISREKKEEVVNKIFY